MKWAWENTSTPRYRPVGGPGGDDRRSDAVVDDDGAGGIMMDLLAQLSILPYTISSYVNDLWVSLKYISTDVLRNKWSYFIAVVVVFFAVACVTVLQATSTKAPIVFLKLAESNVGENDMLLVPFVTQGNYSTNSDPSKPPVWSTSPCFRNDSSSLGENYTAPLFSGGLLLNASYIERCIAGAHYVKGSTPRWTLLAQVGNRYKPGLNSTVVVLVIDSQKEKDLGLGRGWELPPLGEGQAYLSKDLMQSLQISKHEEANFFLDIPTLLKTISPSNTDLNNTAIISLMKSAFINASIQAVQNETVHIDSSGASLIDSVEAALGVNLPPAVQSIIDGILGGVNATGGTDVDLGKLLTPPVLSDIFDALIAPYASGEALRIGTHVTIMDAIESPAGKWPSNLGSVLILESRYLPLLAADLLPLGIGQNPRMLANLLQKVPGYTMPPVELQDNPSVLLRDFPIDAWAMTVLVQFNDRIEGYSLPGSERRIQVVKWANSVSREIGFDAPLTVQMPLGLVLEGLDIADSLLVQVLVAIVMITVVLCIIVIYSLLLTSVEEKKYEFGMIRALGLRHNSVVQLLILQGLLYSLPGIAIGLAVAWLLYLGVSYEIGWYTSLPMDTELPMSAVALGAIMGFVMPVVANILPIRSALSKTLRVALDLYHRDEAETNVTTIRLATLGVDLPQTVVASMMVGLGFGVFYLVPLSFIMQYWWLFFLLANLSMIGMIGGLAMVASAFQSTVEGWMLHLLLFDRLATLKPLVRKSLAAHRSRNKKTATMFTTAATFIIFAATIFHLEGQTVIINSQLLAGSDVGVFSISRDSPLPEDDIRAYLERLKTTSNSTLEGKHVKSYTFMSYPYNMEDGIYSVRMGSFPWFNDANIHLFGVESNYLHTAFDALYVPDETQSTIAYSKTPHGKPDMIKALYTHANETVIPLDAKANKYDVMVSGKVYHNNRTHQNTPSLVPNTIALGDNAYYYENYVDAVLSTGVQGLNIYLDLPGYLEIRYTYDTSSWPSTAFRYMVKPIGFASKMPGFLTFTWIKQLAVAGFQPALVSMDTIQRIRNDTYNERVKFAEKYGLKSLDPNLMKPPTDPIAKQKLLVRLEEGSSSHARTLVIDGIRNFVKDNKKIIVYDIRELLESLEIITTVLELFFYVITFIALTLCFFVLWTSFTSNVMENSWEFGVLRAVGLSKLQVMGIYVFEGVAIVITSTLMAVLIGLIVATTMILQFSLFNNVEVDIYFPYGLFSFLFITSLGFTFLGTVLPAWQLGKKDIAVALRGA